MNNQIANVYMALTLPGTIGKTFHILSHVILRQTYEIGMLIITSVLQIR